MHVLHVILWLVLMCDSDYSNAAAVKRTRTSGAFTKVYHACMMNCPKNCFFNKCRMDGTCLICTDGFHGPDCSKSCSSSCYDKTCSMNGVCASCLTGFYGNECNMPCHKNCLTCVSVTKCGKCKPGFHGEDCGFSCPSNCINCTHEGYCGLCKPGYRGNTCNETCSLCKNGTACRQRDGYCEQSCKVGYTSENCSQKCHPNCRTCIRNKETSCTECADGRFGVWFTTQYNLHVSYCLKKCRVCLNGKCDPTDGRCLDGCIEGRWGVKCDWKCGQFCNGGMCDRDSGQCTAGCVSGHWGETCNGTCVKNCEVCENEIECIRCEPGRYLSNCSDQCSLGCARIKGKLVCDINDGSCIAGCLNGYYGDTCRDECSRNCINETCDRDSSSCRLGCLPGHFGANCSIAMNETWSMKTCNMVWIIMLAVVNVILIATIIITVLIFKRTGHSAVSTYLTPVSGNGTSRERQPGEAIAVTGHSAISNYRPRVDNDTDASEENQTDGVIVRNDNQANEEIVEHFSEAISGHVYVEMDSHTDQDHQPRDSTEGMTEPPHRCDIEISTYESIGLQTDKSVEAVYESIV